MILRVPSSVYAVGVAPVGGFGRAEFGVVRHGRPSYSDANR